MNIDKAEKHMIKNKKTLIILSHLILLLILFASCTNLQKDEVQKHEIEIKPVKVDVKVDITVTEETEDKKEIIKED